ncbi:MAG TPA: cadherin repeat domain-containing protein, partial [Verrucomicrobiae bacterium]
PGETKQIISSANFTAHQNNNAPALAPIPNLTVLPGKAISLQLTAIDPDLPYQSLTFSLDSGAPADATINPATGLFTWLSPSNRTLATYPVTIRVTDNGFPQMSDAQTLNVTVSSNLLTTAVTLSSTGTIWRYLDNGSDPGSAWRYLNFNDASWKSGPARLGYGFGSESTIVNFGSNALNKFITTYFRRQFYVPDANRVQSLIGRLLRDDGAVVYLNGVEIWRDNLPAGPVSANTLASNSITDGTKTNFLIAGFSPSLLITGTNLIAAEIHQAATNGPDIGFDFELSGLATVPVQSRLVVSATPSAITLNWPVEAGLLQLYAASSLQAPINWLRVTNAPTLTNGQWQLTLPTASNSYLFYRLQTQP